MPLSRTDPNKGGEGGVLQLANGEFINAVFPTLLERAFAAVCSKSGDPSKGGWPAQRADQAILTWHPQPITMSIVPAFIMEIMGHSGR